MNSQSWQVGKSPTELHKPTGFISFFLCLLYASLCKVGKLSGSWSQVGKLTGSWSQVGDLPTCQLREFCLRKKMYVHVYKMLHVKGP